jgi:hypothetical protein
MLISDFRFQISKDNFEIGIEYFILIYFQQND